MSKNKHGKDNIDAKRRDVLKATGAAASFGAIDLTGIQTARTEDPEFYLGDVQYVETIVEHEDAPQRPRTHRDGLIEYVVDEPTRRLTLTGAPLDVFQTNDTVVTTGNDFYGLPASIPKLATTDRLTVTADYSRLREEILALEDQYTVPHVQLSAEGGDTVTATADGRNVTVAADDTATLELEPRDVKVRGQSTGTKMVENPRTEGDELIEVAKEGSVEPVAVTPTVKVRNHGTLKVYGTPNGRVLPLDSTNEYAQNRVSSILSAPDNDIQRTDEADLLVLYEGGE